MPNNAFNRRATLISHPTSNKIARGRQVINGLRIVSTSNPNLGSPSGGPSLIQSGSFGSGAYTPWNKQGQLGQENQI